jgi:hypothetical protein
MNKLIGTFLRMVVKAFHIVFALEIEGCLLGMGGSQSLFLPVPACSACKTVKASPFRENSGAFLVYSYLVNLSTN